MFGVTSSRHGRTAGGLLLVSALVAGCSGNREPPLVEPVIGHTYPISTPTTARDDATAQYGNPDDAAPPPPPAPEIDGELLVDEIIVDNCALGRGTRRMKYDGVDVHAGVELDALAECLGDPTMKGTFINIIGYSDPPDGAGLKRADALAEALAARAVEQSRMDTYAHLPAGAVSDAVLVRLDD